jgi:ABC-type glutathione transport system ATPase component
MFIVTHEMAFAAEFADRVLMFDQGKIVEEGPPARVSRRRKTRARDSSWAPFFNASDREPAGKNRQLKIWRVLA